MAALTSDEYRRELERLRNDPAIRAMAAGLGADQRRPDVLESHDFMLAAMREAQARKVEFFSIGGPAKAIRAILEEA